MVNAGVSSRSFELEPTLLRPFATTPLKLACDADTFMFGRPIILEPSCPRGDTLVRGAMDDAVSIILCFCLDCSRAYESTSAGDIVCVLRNMPRGVSLKMTFESVAVLSLEPLAYYYSLKHDAAFCWFCLMLL